MTLSCVMNVVQKKMYGNSGVVNVFVYMQTNGKNTPTHITHRRRHEKTEEKIISYL